MPSFLGEYARSAKDKPRKFERAVASVLSQSFRDFELIIVSDGCEKTFELLDAMVKNPAYTEAFDKIQAYIIPKQPLWSGKPRNIGILKAQGEFIVYLDTDDRYRENYLLELAESIASGSRHDWYWVNDLRWNKYKGYFAENHCSIEAKGKCGTSNIIHRRSLTVFWADNGKYDHDWVMITKLKQASANHKKLPVLGYEVCHLPNFVS